MHEDVFTLHEIARAAGAAKRDAEAAADATGVGRHERQTIRAAQAVQLVRALRRREPPERAAITLIPNRRRKNGLALVASGMAHALLALLILGLGSLGLLRANYTDQLVNKPSDVKLVFLLTPGPGGGGGGGGLQMPEPPPAAKLAAPVPKRQRSPVPPVRKVVPRQRPVPPRPAPPQPIPTPPPPLRVEPKPTPIPATPAPAVNAPVVPMPADPVSTAGLPVDRSPSTTPSAGPGSGGGIGSGAGTGLGEGQGSGIGPGSGGGTGGGTYGAGSGIEPPVLLREVRPLYTDEARRRSIEGDVVMEIVVKQDGTVGNVKVTRGLGAGLEQKAIEAVRQWRFDPARRRGAPVDVVVEVSVGFKLR